MTPGRAPIRRAIGHALSIVAIAALSVAGYASAYLLRFAGEPPPYAVVILIDTIGYAVLAKLGAAYWFRVHRGWSRYVTFHDLVALAKAVTSASVALTIINAMLFPKTTIPRSVMLLDWGVTLGLLAAVRGFPRLVRDGRWRAFAGDRRVRVLIVGAGDAGETLVRTLHSSPQLNCLPVGFVDDRVRADERIAGVPVLGRVADLAAIARRHRIAEALIVAGDLPGRVVRDIVQQAEAASVRVKVLPSFEQLLTDRVAVQPRPVAIADLLRRPSVELDDEAVRQWLGGRVLMVTGSAGSIGSEICRQLLRLSPARLLLVDRSETGQFFLERELRELAPGAAIDVVIADAGDADRMRCVFAERRPEVVFHAAAYKHVPLMEAHPGEAVKNIVLATRRLADLADEFQTEGFVMISTDKAVNPASVMGACKRLAEQYVEAKACGSSCRFVTVRFGNVLDSAGSVVPIFREQIARGGPVTVTHADMVRYFMLIPEAAQLVIQAGAMGRGGEIFVLDMGEPVRILDLARDMIRLSGLREGEDIEIAITGLRSGEKLFEELYGADEARRPTLHSKIMAAVGMPRKLLQVIYDIGRLEGSVNAPAQVVRDLLCQIVAMHVDTAIERDSQDSANRRAA